MSTLFFFLGQNINIDKSKQLDWTVVKKFICLTLLVMQREELIQWSSRETSTVCSSAWTGNRMFITRPCFSQHLLFYRSSEMDHLICFMVAAVRHRKAGISFLNIISITVIIQFSSIKPTRSRVSWTISIISFVSSHSSRSLLTRPWLFWILDISRTLTLSISTWRDRNIETTFPTPTLADPGILFRLTGWVLPSDCNVGCKDLKKLSLIPSTAFDGYL